MTHCNFGRFFRLTVAITDRHTKPNRFLGRALTLNTRLSDGSQVSRSGFVRAAQKLSADTPQEVMEAREAGHRTWLGRGTVRSLRPGSAFDLIGLPVDPAKAEAEPRRLTLAAHVWTSLFRSIHVELCADHTRLGGC